MKRNKTGNMKLGMLHKVRCRGSWYPWNPFVLSGLNFKLPLKATERKGCYSEQNLSCASQKYSSAVKKKKKDRRYIYFQKAMRSCKGSKYRHIGMNVFEIKVHFSLGFCGLFKWRLLIWLLFLAGFTGKQLSHFQRWTEVVFSLEMVAAEQHASKIHSAAQRN